MALFSKKENKNYVTNQTENKQVAAGSNGFAVGAGSNVSVENVSDEIAADAFDANKQVSRDAFDANREVSRDAFELADDTLERFASFGESALGKVADTTARQTSDFLSFADSFTQREKDSVEDQLDRHNKFAMHTNELIAAQAGVTSPADGKRNQYLVWGALGLVALFVLSPQLRNTAKKATKAR